MKRNIPCNLNKNKMQQQILLSKQSTQVGFALSITDSNKKQRKKYINFHDHQNSAIDIVAVTGSSVITYMDG